MLLLFKRERFMRPLAMCLCKAVRVRGGWIPAARKTGTRKKEGSLALFSSQSPLQRFPNRMWRQSFSTLAPWLRAGRNCEWFAIVVPLSERQENGSKGS